MKKIIFANQTNPLLEDISKLNQPRPEKYESVIYMVEITPEQMWYVGSHIGSDSVTEYIGSGRKFRQVFHHYGLQDSKRIILEYIEDKSNTKTREQHWLDKFNCVKSPRFYNMKNVIR